MPLDMDQNMDLEEAEIQVLASVFGAESDQQATDRAALESRGQERYWIFYEDWSRAFGKLVDKALIDGDDDGYLLTEQSRSLAESYFKDLNQALEDLAEQGYGNQLLSSYSIITTKAQ